MKVENFPMDYTIDDLNVLISFTHPYSDEILGELIFSPTADTPTESEAQIVQLFTLAGGTALDAVHFDDDASSTIPSTPGSIVGPGFFLPLGDLTVFEGKSTAGTWELKITDSAPAASHGLDGVVTEFCITATTNTAHDIRKLTEYRRGDAGL